MTENPWVDDKLQDPPMLAEIVEAEPAMVLEPLPFPGFWSALGCTVAMLMVQMVVGTVIVIAGMIAGYRPEQLIGELILVSVVAVNVAALALAVLLYRQRLGQVIAWRMPGPLHLVLITLILLPCWVVAAAIGQVASRSLSSINEDSFARLAVEYPLWLVLLSGCLLPAVGEELFFRATLGRGLVARFGPWIGVLLSTLLFALMHVDPVQMVGVVSIGLVLHGVYLATRSLVAPMLLHGVNNALSFVLLRYEGVDPDQELPWGLFFAALLALSVLGVAFFQTRTRWIMPDGEVWTPGFASAEIPPASASARRTSDWPTPAVLVAAIASYTLFLAVLIHGQ